jgi:hypothetical protein
MGFKDLKLLLWNARTLYGRSAAARVDLYIQDDLKVKTRMANPSVPEVDPEADSRWGWLTREPRRLSRVHSRKETRLGI